MFATIKPKADEKANQIGNSDNAMDRDNHPGVPSKKK
jgi:hypothetical protein